MEYHGLEAKYVKNKGTDIFFFVFWTPFILKMYTFSNNTLFKENFKSYLCKIHEEIVKLLHAGVTNIYV